MNSSSNSVLKSFFIYKTHPKKSGKKSKKSEKNPLNLKKSNKTKDFFLRILNPYTLFGSEQLLANFPFTIVHHDFGHFYRVQGAYLN